MFGSSTSTLTAKQLLTSSNKSARPTDGPATFLRGLAGISGWVLTERKPLMLLNGHDDPRENDFDRARRKASRTGAIIEVPLYAQDRASAFSLPSIPRMSLTSRMRTLT